MKNNKSNASIKVFFIFLLNLHNLIILPIIKYILNRHNINPKTPLGASNTKTCKINDNNPITSNIVHKII